MSSKKIKEANKILPNVTWATLLLRANKFDFPQLPLTPTTRRTQVVCVASSTAAGVATLWHTSLCRAAFTLYTIKRAFFTHANPHTHTFFHFLLFQLFLFFCCAFVFMEIAVQLFRQISHRISISLVDGEVVFSLAALYLRRHVNCCCRCCWPFMYLFIHSFF